MTINVWHPFLTKLWRQHLQKEAAAPVPEPVNVFLGPENSRLVIHDIKEDEILKYLEKFGPFESTGVDEIPQRLPLMLNKSSMEKNVLSIWKVANVKLIYKKGNKNHSNNYYYPVGWTSVFIKIFEKNIAGVK